MQKDMSHTNVLCRISLPSCWASANIQRASGASSQSTSYHNHPTSCLSSVCGHPHPMYVFFRSLCVSFVSFAVPYCRQIFLLLFPYLFPWGIYQSSHPLDRSQKRVGSPGFGGRTKVEGWMYSGVGRREEAAEDFG